MKKNTKGFTLIELLAVIVILAIIALIATPIVLNIINSARKSAAARSAEGVRSSLKTQYFAQMALNPDTAATEVTIDFASATKDTEVTAYGVKLGEIIDGKLPSDGTVTISTDGKVTGVDLKFDSYYCSFGNNGSATCNKTASGATGS